MISKLIKCVYGINKKELSELDTKLARIQKAITNTGWSFRK
jgi:hypothetical protein